MEVINISETDEKHCLVEMELDVEEYKAICKRVPRDDEDNDETYNEKIGKFIAQIIIDQITTKPLAVEEFTDEMIEALQSAECRSGVDYDY